MESLESFVEVKQAFAFQTASMGRPEELGQLEQRSAFRMSLRAPKVCAWCRRDQCRRENQSQEAGAHKA